MPFTIENKLVIAVASSALFDLSEPDAVFRRKGDAAYRAYQHKNEHRVLKPGVAFPFIRRLLSLNEPGGGEDGRRIEVVLLSRNDPDTGLRVFNSIEHYQLDITRAAFTTGRSPYPYIEPFNACLFLSANAEDVREAVEKGYAAGCVLPCAAEDSLHDRELRIAFDFDGVLVADEAETVFQTQGIDEFFAAERDKALEELKPGPLHKLLLEIAKIHQAERAKVRKDPKYKPRIRVAIITSRNAPAHKRLVLTLRRWGILVDETFFLGGMDKTRILQVFRPHLFFDDQMGHASPAAAANAPAVHVPFGIANRKVARAHRRSRRSPRRR